MSLILSAFQAWSGETLSLIPAGDLTNLNVEEVHLSASSPIVKLSLLEDGLHFKMWAPWWENAPPDAPPGSVWGLWNYEVLELFIVGASGRYLELEVGPHGHHLMLSLSAPREVEQVYEEFMFEARAPINQEHFLAELGERREAGEDRIRARAGWSARGVISHDRLPEPLRDSNTSAEFWRVNSFWCFQAHEERFHCCAHPLPGPSPDFHQPERFLSWRFKEA